MRTLTNDNHHMKNISLKIRSEARDQLAVPDAFDRLLPACDRF